MIEITQAGQSGKTHLLFDMHRLRAQIFKEKMGWDVDVNHLNMEIDQFDIPEAIYFLALDDNQDVIGSLRILPTSGPTMIRDVWPDALKTIDVPEDYNIWEATRFGVDISETDIKKKVTKMNKAMGELVHALVETCLLCKVPYIYSLYDQRIAKIMKKLGCEPDQKSEQFMVDDLVCEVVRFRISPNLLKSVKLATGIEGSLIKDIDLPVALVSRSEQNKEVSYG